MSFLLIYGLFHFSIFLSYEVMSTYKFTEILNDLWDYFILADPFTLLDYTKQHDLPDNLITHITMTDFGDKVVKEGKMIPLSNVQNYPYTIYFNLTGENIELLFDVLGLTINLVILLGTSFCDRNFLLIFVLFVIIECLVKGLFSTKKTTICHSKFN